MKKTSQYSIEMYLILPTEKLVFTASDEFRNFLILFIAGFKGEIESMLAVQLDVILTFRQTNAFW
jgi:hypothetical protein